MGYPPFGRNPRSGSTFPPTLLAHALPLWLYWILLGLVAGAFGVTTLLLLFAFVYFWNRIVYTVQSGEEAVLWKRLSGTQIDVIYKEGGMGTGEAFTDRLRPVGVTEYRLPTPSWSETK